MRILLYTGKGGVGKTSVAAATALRCAELGHRTVVISTDSAHSLADSFDLPLGPEPTPVTTNLWGQELDLLHQMKKHWGDVQRFMASALAWRGLDGIVAEEMTVLPGMEELASLLQVVYLHDTGHYDVVIIDCAPTGAALQMLTLPEVGRWYIEKIFPLQKKAIALGTPLLRALTDLPIPDGQVFDAVEDMFRRLERMQELLTDPQLTSARLVLNPEKMVIKETQRAYTYLSLYGYATDAIVCNRLLPPQTMNTYLGKWVTIQAHYRRMAEEAFTPLPVLEVPFFDREVVGLDMLKRMGDALFAGHDPAGVLYTGDTQKVLKVDGGYDLCIPLPLVTGEDIQLTRSSSDELIIHIGNRKHVISLPHTLAAMQVESARYRDNALRVAFRRDSRADTL